jgi:4-hydroxy-tetrahydrodipicolinate reductase
VPGAPDNVSVLRSIDDALALTSADVLIDFTTHEIAVKHALVGIESRLHVVLGATGFAPEHYIELDRAARAEGVAVAACDSFAVSAALAGLAARIAARYLRCDGVVDVAAPGIRSPLNTTRWLAEEIAAECGNPPAIRSVRDGSAFSVVEASFATSDERITIRHESTAFSPYAAGALAAARALPGRIGLFRRLDELLDPTGPFVG